jgi:hypothetical protein
VFRLERGKGLGLELCNGETKINKRNRNRERQIQ